MAKDFQDHKEALKDFLAKLEQGKIDADATEVFEIATPEGRDRFDIVNPEQQHVEEYINKIVRRLLSSEFAAKNLLKGKEIPSFRVFVQSPYSKWGSKEEENACIVSGANPPVMLLTRGLLKAFMKDGREDLLAGVIGHELTHYLIEMETGRKDNSKGEEGFADALPTFMLYHAGYQYTGLQDAMKIIGDKSSGFIKALSYLDVHPSPPLRARFIEDSFGVLAQSLRRKLKNFSGVPLAEATPFPAGLQEVVEKFTYTNVIEEDFKAAGLATMYWNVADNDEHEPPSVTRSKVNFIADNIDTWLDPRKIGPMTLHKRARDLNEINRSCFEQNANNATKFSPLILEPLITKVLTSNLPLSAGIFRVTSYADSPKSTAFFAKDSYGSIPYAGLPASIKAAYDNVIALMDRDKPPELGYAIRRSQQLTDLIESVSPPQRRQLEFNHAFGSPATLSPGGDSDKKKIFSLWSTDGTEGIEPPWDNLVQLALKEYAEQATTFIGNALLLTGINDARLQTIPAQNPAGSGSNAFRFLKPRFPSPIRNTDGRIVATYTSGEYDSLNIRSDRLYHIKSESYKTPTAQVLAKARAELKRTEAENDAETDTMLPLVKDRIAGLDNPEQIHTLLMEFPLQFTYPIRLMGTQPHNTEAAALLVARLEELAQAEPDIWLPVMRDFFASRNDRAKTDAETRSMQLMSAHTVLSRLRSISSDHPLSGQHTDISDYENTNKMGDPGKVDIYAPEEMGMSSRHPYVQFVLDHTDGTASGDSAVYFSLPETLTVLDRTVMMDVSGQDGVKLSAPKMHMVDEYLRLIKKDRLAESDVELGDRLESLRLSHPAFPWEVRYGEVSDPEGYGSLFMIYHARHEAHEYLKNNAGKPFGVKAFGETIKAMEAKVGYESYTSFETGRAFVEYTMQLLDRQFVFNATNDIAAANADPNHLAAAYALYEKNGYFQKHPDLRWGKAQAPGYDDLISACISNFGTASPPRPEEQRKFAETILYGCNVQSPELRNKLIESWASAVRLQKGIDKTPAFDLMQDHPELDGYYADVTGILDEVLDKTKDSALLHEAMLHKLCDKLETQNGLTQMVYERSTAHSRRQASSKHASNKSPLAEYGLDFIVGEERTRLQTINLLTSPLTDDSINAYIDVLEQRQRLIRESDFDAQGMLNKFAANPIDTIFGVATHKIDFGNPVKRQEIGGKLKALYDNFWESSLETRTYYMSLMAFPEKGGIARADKTLPFTELADFILDKVLPYNDKEPMTSAFNRYTDWGRDFIYAYTDSASLAEKRLLLSALMVSAKSLADDATRDEESIGKALALVLQNMGPAGVKLAQAIHSFPETPAPIRKGMEAVKGNANKPDRKEIFDRASIAIPETHEDENRLSLDKISHIGTLLGAGAYQHTSVAELVKPLGDQSTVALTLLRDNVLTFANNEFTHFDKTIDKFTSLRQKPGEEIGTQTVSAFKQILHQANNMASIETDYDVGKTQAQLMSDRYNGLVIRAGNRNIVFRTVDWIDHASKSLAHDQGEDILAYKVASIAPGMPFNRWTATAGEDELSALCPALQTAEDIMMLSAQHFDHDRHGDNFQVLVLDSPGVYNGVQCQAGDIIVTEYDFGAVNLSPPSPEERKILGKAIAASIADIRKGGDIGDSLVQRLSAAINERNAKTDRGHEDFLSCALRGLLARGDFVRHLDETSLSAAAGAALSSGAIDTSIITSAATVMAGSSALSGKAGSSFKTAAPKKNDPVELKVVSLPEAFKSGNSGGMPNFITSMLIKKAMQYTA